MRQAIENDLLSRTVKCFFERDLEIEAQIGPALRAGSPPLCAARVSKEHVEDVAERAGAESEVAGTRAVAGGAEPIVLRALPRIGEHFVGFVDLLEIVLGPGFIVRNVRMVLARQIAIGSFDLVPRCIASDAEDIVVILRGHFTRLVFG